MSTVFDEMRTALRSYPTEQVELEFVDLNELDNRQGGDDVNTHDRYRFKIRIDNRGPVTLDDAVIEVTALAGTQVSRSPEADWQNSVRTDPIKIGGGVVRKHTPTLYFKAPPTAGPNTLMEATIVSWNADLTGLLNRHSVAADGPLGMYATNVVGS